VRIALRKGPHEIQILWPEEVLHFPSQPAALAFLRPFMADAANRATVRQALVESGRRDLARWRDDEVLEELAARVGRAEVYIVAGPNVYGRTGPDLGIPPAPPVEVTPREAERAAREGRTEPVVEEKTWLEIELVDEEGNPIPGEQYAVTLPDGAIRVGRLDAEGRARLAGLDPGTCKVSFPDLDARRWKFVKKA
jgi:hypothetical protein